MRHAVWDTLMPERKTMWKATLALVYGISLVGCGQSDPPVPPEAIEAEKEAQQLALRAADGTKVFAWRYPAGNKKAERVILCFHQAGSNAAEYAAIAPRFNKLGFDCLAIDQRSGGEMWGRENKTAAQFPENPGYMNAYPDLVSALDWAKSEGYKKIVACGSSYSASLAMKLASEHPEVSAVMAFSPGEYFDIQRTTRSWNAQVAVPTLFACDKAGGAEGVINIMGGTPDLPGRHRDSIAINKEGVHGASTLRPDRNPKSAEFYWKAVEDFLAANL